ncbi:Prefoldin subunit-domain-containing protein [Polychytrium aggregatum]|uniref:Prefoldin subunit-domain-containing protein n=1 Tax=Polychytrium aggregatum TaxID=110093 RepID=UPI0022FE36B3|nr:Prefoldin subunit-domain-containing protein [Polychytrium aggregatum]KAI9206588.1 Prefoldin subunit-domain-containing protein [Polychytrium aggregatum]
MAAIPSNPRGIPKAPFIGNIDEFIVGSTVDDTLRKFQEMISKYKYMEVHLLQRKKNLDNKLPEIKKTLDIVRFLVGKKETDPDTPIETQFELNETLWASAKIQPRGTVYLWLGANVMLEYSTEEASELLSEKYDTAGKRLLEVDEDLNFLREQITTMEVNTARVHNWDVKRRREQTAKA